MRDILLSFVLCFVSTCLMAIPIKGIVKDATTGEELTLYSIEQNKKIEQLEGVVKSYQTLFEKVEKLENAINQ